MLSQGALTPGGLDQFITDIEPFFYRRNVTYVDVGAFQGAVFTKLLQSNIAVAEAHLIEPNAESFAHLKEAAERIFNKRSLNLYNIALSSKKATLRLKAAKTMTRVVEEETAAKTIAKKNSSTFTVAASTLDDMAEMFSNGTISLLKIDVEGHEADVLAGAERMLREQKIDVLYIEAGADPNGKQQCYYRLIDDVMMAHKYRLFRIYEQTHEWLEDAPFLRRMNLAYFSERFAEGRPLRLIKELFAHREQNQELKTALSTEQAKAASLRRVQADLEQATAAAEKALAKARADVANHEAARQQAMKEVGALEKSITRLTKRTETLENEAAALSDKIAARDTMIAQLREDLAEQRERTEARLARAVEKREAIVARYDERIAASERETEAKVAKLVQELHAAREEARELRQTLSLQSGAQDELTRQAQTFEATRAQDAARLSALSAELDGLTHAIAAKHETIAELADQLAASEAERAQISATMEAQIADLEAKLQEESRRRTVQVAEREATAALLIDQLHASAATLDMERAEQAALLARAEEISAERDSALGRLEAAERALADEQARAKQALQENATVEAAVRAELQGRDARLAEVQTALDNARADSAILEASLHAAAAEAAESAERALEREAELHARLSALQADLEANRAHAAEVAAAEAAARAALATLEQDRATRDAEYAAEVASLRARAEDADALIVQLRQAIVDAAAENDKARLQAATAHAELTAKLDAAAAQLAHVGAEKLALADQIAASDAAARALHARVEALASERLALATLADDAQAALDRHRAAAAAERTQLLTAVQAGEDRLQEALAELAKAQDGAWRQTFAAAQAARTAQDSAAELAERDKVITFLRSEVQKVERRIAEIQDAHRVKIDEMKAERAALKAEIKEKREGAKVERRALKDEIGAGKQTTATLRRELKQELIRRSTAEALLASMQASTSWRVTAPIRRLKDAVDRLRRGDLETTPAAPEVAPAANADAPLTIVESAPVTTLTPAPHAQTQSVKALETSLWGGFSRPALAELNAIVASPQAPRRDVADAAWTLASWHAAEGEFERALDLCATMRAAGGGRSETPARVLLEAFCLVRSGRFERAREIVAPLAKSQPENIDLQFALANSYAGDIAASETRLALINQAYERFGLVPLKRRDAKRGLSVDNLTTAALPPAKGDANARVSVIVPTFNGAETLDFALTGLINQTWRNLEVIAVDDASTDGTLDILESYAKRDKRIVVLRQERNQGSYSARNLALGAATGAFITVHDANDWSHPQKIERQARHLLDNADFAANHSNWARVIEDLVFAGKFRRKDKIVDWNPSSFFVRRSVLDAVGGWDRVRVSADAEFMRRVKQTCSDKQVGAIPEAAPLAFAYDTAASLTKTSETHGRTISHGLRREYHEAAAYWHAHADASVLRLHSKRSGRPFPAPGNMLADRQTIAECDLLVIADFNLGGEHITTTLQEIDAAAARGRRVGVFQWRVYGQDVSTPLSDEVRERAMRGRLQVIAPGARVRARAVCVATPASLVQPIDLCPQVDFTDLFVMADRGAAPADEMAARATLREFFAVEGTWLPSAQILRSLMQQEQG